MKKETFQVDDITVNSYYVEGKFTEEYKTITKAVAEDSLRIFNKKSDVILIMSWILYLVFSAMAMAEWNIPVL